MYRVLAGVLAIIASCVVWAGGSARPVPEPDDDSVMNVDFTVFKVADMKDGEARRPIYGGGCIGWDVKKSPKEPVETGGDDLGNGLKHSLKLTYRNRAFPLTVDISYHFESYKGLDRTMDIPKEIVIEQKGVVFEDPGTRLIASADHKYILILEFSPTHPKPTTTAPAAGRKAGEAIQLD